MFTLLPLLKTWIVMLTKYWFYGYDELFVLFAQDKKKVIIEEETCLK